MKQLSELEKKGVFIHTYIEHYPDGSNLNFNLEFKEKGFVTCSYGDNHEFGDCGEAMAAAIKLANWYLDNPQFLNNNRTGEEEVAFIETLKK